MKTGLLAAVLPAATVTLLPGAVAYAQRDIVPPPIEWPSPRVAGPDPIQSAAAALRQACIHTPSETPASWIVPRSAIERDDMGLCSVMNDPLGFEWSLGVIGAAVAVVGLFVAAIIIGLLRMILVGAWSWRPLRNTLSGLR